ncbi:MAG TPA: YraN family protein, partial [Candidatus Peregrinibacteria bacterium]|nr:YraN family protein [Candidatus Peregrinibacteria bacterium]
KVDTLYRKKLGAKGEKYAQEYLLKKGYQILDEHVCFFGGEIDLIAKKKEMIIFVEVKTRSNEGYVPLEDSFSKKKIALVKRAADRWLEEHEEYNNFNYSIDIIGLLYQGEKFKKIIHLKNITL